MLRTQGKLRSRHAVRKTKVRKKRILRTKVRHHHHRRYAGVRGVRPKTRKRRRALKKAHKPRHRTRVRVKRTRRRVARGHRLHRRRHGLKRRFLGRHRGHRRYLLRRRHGLRRRFLGRRHAAHYHRKRHYKVKPTQGLSPISASTYMQMF